MDASETAMPTNLQAGKIDYETSGDESDTSVQQPKVHHSQYSSKAPAGMPRAHFARCTHSSNREANNEDTDMECSGESNEDLTPEQSTILRWGQFTAPTFGSGH